MCTLLLSFQHHPGTSLVVAANRDERLDRPATAPRLWLDRPLRVLAPEDLEAGGTWMGLNEAGLFAGLTNRFVQGPDPGRVDPQRPSRGGLVLEALTHASAAGAREALAHLPGDRHNPFHLLLADAEEAHLVWSDGWKLHCEVLAPGLHILTERSRGAAPSRREEALGRWSPELTELRPGLAEHRSPGIEGTCVHWPERNYGTRSSALLVLGKSGDHRFEYTEGPPCTAPWQDGTELLAQLGFLSGTQSVAK
ncbi:MAG: NRDE family protein [Myxococcota bacterium]|nr:NRDE family protein [Myxococcota bacterium]